MTGSERRGEKRVAPSFEINAFDAASEQLVGRVANLSITGMLLVGDTAIAEESVVKLRLVSSDSNYKVIDVEVEGLWCDSQEGGSVWSGVQFATLNPAAIVSVAHLIAAFES